LQVAGAFWYLFSIERETSCWQEACRNNTAVCSKADMYCNDYLGGLSKISTFLNTSCPIQNADKNLFDFGMFLDALQSGVVESRDFPQKFFYCFWWGLKNLRCTSLIFIFTIRYEFRFEGRSYYVAISLLFCGFFWGLTCNNKSIFCTVAQSMEMFMIVPSYVGGLVVFTSSLPSKLHASSGPSVFARSCWADISRYIMNGSSIKLMYLLDHQLLKLLSNIL